MVAWAALARSMISRYDPFFGAGFWLVAGVVAAAAAKAAATGFVPFPLLVVFGLLWPSGLADVYGREAEFGGCGVDGGRGVLVDMVRGGAGVWFAGFGRAVVGERVGPPAPFRSFPFKPDVIVRAALDANSGDGSSVAFRFGGCAGVGGLGVASPVIWARRSPI